MSQTVRHLYEFGPFRLDTTDRLLLRGEEHVPLTPKAFETLLVLVEHGGHVIDKNELMKKVWPNTFVEEVNLAKNVSSLRKILGGKESEQHYIETIPKRGYRFVAGVREVWSEETIPEIHISVSPNGEIVAPPETTHPSVVSSEKAHAVSFSKTVAWPLVFVLIGATIAVGIWTFVTRSKAKAPTSLFTIAPVTSLSGTEDQAAFSPDGKQIAFVWDGGNEDNSDIYVKLLGAEQPLRLTTNPAADTDPTWSPDGRDIAFLRQSAKDGALFVTSSLGGSERKLADVFPYRPVVTGNTLSYSPDGKFLLVPDKKSNSDPFSIFSVDVTTGEKKRMTTPPAGAIGDLFPAYSPDSRALAFVRSISIASADIYLLYPDSAEPKRLTFDDTSIRGLSWTSDGKEIVFASRRGGSNYALWKISTVDGVLERLTANDRDVYSPTVSQHNNRLSYTQSMSDPNVWQFDLSKNRTEENQARKIIASTLEENGPQYSPDGRRIVFASRRSGSFEIWVCDRNGENPRQLTNMGGPLTGTPRWSPDSTQIVFDSWVSGNAAIYVISAEGGTPRRVTFDRDEDVTPSWSRDGRWLYFGCTRSGSMQIWKVPAEGGPAVQVTRDGGFEGFESVDGKYFYYAKGRAIPGIWRVPVAGGEETLVVENHQAGLWRYWAITGKGIYFATAETPSHPVVEFFNFETQKTTIIQKLNRPLFKTDPGLAISPDGQSMLVVQMDQKGSDIMLMESFR